MIEALKPRRYWIILQGDEVYGDTPGTFVTFGTPEQAGKVADKLRAKWKDSGYPLRVKVEPVMMLGGPEIQWGQS